MMFAGNDKKPVGGHILAHACLPSPPPPLASLLSVHSPFPDSLLPTSILVLLLFSYMLEVVRPVVTVAPQQESIYAREEQKNESRNYKIVLIDLRRKRVIRLPRGGSRILVDLGI
jgi:hypothetical protein